MQGILSLDGKELAAKAWGRLPALRALLRDSAKTLVGEGGIFVAAILLGILTARWLGPEGKGYFGVVVGASGILMTVLTLRFERSVSYFLASGKAGFGSVVAMSLLAGVVALVVSGLVVWTVPGLFLEYVFKGVPLSAVWSSFLVMASVYLRGVIAAILAGEKKFGLRAWFLGGAYAFETLVAAIGLIGFGCNAWSLLVVIGVAGILGCCVVLVIMILHSGTPLKINADLLRGMYSFASAGTPAMLSDIVTVRLDLFLVNYFVGASEAGIYIVSLSFANMLSYGPTALKTVLMPHVASSALATPGSMTSRLTRSLVLAVGGLVPLLMLAVHFLLVPVYGEAFAPSWWPFLLLLPGTVMWLVFGVIGADIEGRGRPGLVSLASLVAAACTIVLDFLLVPPFGAPGAAIASSIAHSVAGLGGCYIFYRMTGEGIRKQIIPTRDDRNDLIRLTGDLLGRGQRALGDRGKWKPKTPAVGAGLEKRIDGRK